MEVLCRWWVHGNGDRLQTHIQHTSNGGLNLGAQALQVLVDALEHVALPLIGGRLHILPEVFHLQRKSLLFSCKTSRRNKITNWFWSHRP